MSDHQATPPPAAESNEQSPAPASEQQLPGPGAFLKSVVGQRVVVRLNSGVDYRGKFTLSSFLNLDLLSPLVSRLFADGAVLVV